MTNLLVHYYLLFHYFVINEVYLSLLKFNQLDNMENVKKNKGFNIKIEHIIKFLMKFQNIRLI